MSRVGVYAGTFDPVHAGHVTFALQSLEAAKLDKIYFLPERRPRSKGGAEHFGHRVAMLQRALKPHPKLEVLELVDLSFNVERTLPHLRERFAGDKIVFMFGSDVIPGLAEWPKVERMLKGGELVVGLRGSDAREMIHEIVDKWPAQPRAVTIFESYAPNVSSGRIREALRRRRAAKGMLKSVERYSDHNWLYISLA